MDMMAHQPLQQYLHCYSPEGAAVPAASRVRVDSPEAAASEGRGPPLPLPQLLLTAMPVPLLLLHPLTRALPLPLLLSPLLPQPQPLP